MGVAIRGDLMRMREGGITFQVSVACIRWVIIDELNDKVELLVSYCRRGNVRKDDRDLCVRCAIRLNSVR
jgi:hypothetical protein